MSNVWRAPVGSLGADTSGAVTASQVAALRARGLSFLIRALAVPGGNIHPAPLTSQEVAVIRAGGLALGLYQIFQTRALTGADQGKIDGQSAAAQAALLGVPQGVSIYGDSEGQGGTAAAVEVAYWQAWGEAVTLAGFAAGIYVGPGPKMSGQQLGTAITSVHGYWQAGAADMPFPYPRGFQLYQLNPADVIIGGQAFDLDVSQVDFRGGVPCFWAPVS